MFMRLKRKEDALYTVSNWLTVNRPILAWQRPKAACYSFSVGILKEGKPSPLCAELQQGWLSGRASTQRCLLKGCEQRFRPRQAHQRYCVIDHQQSSFLNSGRSRATSPAPRAPSSVDHQGGSPRVQCRLEGGRR